MYELVINQFKFGAPERYCKFQSSWIQIQKKKYKIVYDFILYCKESRPRAIFYINRRLMKKNDWFICKERVFSKLEYFENFCPVATIFVSSYGQYPVSSQSLVSEKNFHFHATITLHKEARFSNDMISNLITFWHENYFIY
jgi:hypothetical protein